jgi:hypothetical protein
VVRNKICSDLMLGQPPALQQSMNIPSTTQCEQHMPTIFYLSLHNNGNNQGQEDTVGATPDMNSIMHPYALNGGASLLDYDTMTAFAGRSSFKSSFRHESGTDPIPVTPAPSFTSSSLRRPREDDSVTGSSQLVMAQEGHTVLTHRNLMDNLQMMNKGSPRHFQAPYLPQMSVLSVRAASISGRSVSSVSRAPSVSNKSARSISSKSRRSRRKRGTSLERLITETILETASVGPKSDFFADDKDDNASHCTSTESILQDLDSLVDTVPSEIGSVVHSYKKSSSSTDGNLLPPIQVNDSDSEVLWSPEALEKSLTRKIGSTSFQSSCFEELASHKRTDGSVNTSLTSPNVSSNSINISKPSSTRKIPSTPDTVLTTDISRGASMNSDRDIMSPGSSNLKSPSNLFRQSSKQQQHLQQAHYGMPNVFSVSQDHESLMVKQYSDPFLPSRFDPPGKVASVESSKPIRLSLEQELWSLSTDDNIGDGWTAFNDGSNPFFPEVDNTSIESPSSIVDFPKSSGTNKWNAEKSKGAFRRYTAEI